MSGQARMSGDGGGMAWGPGSITLMLDQLRDADRRGSDAAAEAIWQRYMSDLVAIARRQLSVRVRRRVDGEDVVVSMYDSFCRRHKEGKFTLRDRRDLWGLLVDITVKKAINAAKKHTSGRRDVRQEYTPVGRQDAHGNGTSSAGVDRAMENAEGLAAPSQLDAHILVEEAERLLSSLDEPLRRIALWKLEGFSNQDIAASDKLDCAERTVERKLNRIRAKWEEAGLLSDGP